MTDNVADLTKRLAPDHRLKNYCRYFCEVVGMLGKTEIIERVETSDGYWVVSATLDKRHDGLAKKAD